LPWKSSNTEHLYSMKKCNENIGVSLLPCFNCVFLPIHVQLGTVIVILQNWAISTWFTENYQCTLHGLMLSSFELRSNRRDWTPYITPTKQHANRPEGHWTYHVLITYNSILSWVTVDFADCFWYGLEQFSLSIAASTFSTSLSMDSRCMCSGICFTPKATWLIKDIQCSWKLLSSVILHSCGNFILEYPRTFYEPTSPWT